MTHLEFSRAVLTAFSLVAPGLGVSVEPYFGELPPHVLGGKTAAITIPSGKDRFVVLYDSRLLKAGPRQFWIETAFHEACHAALNAFGTDRASALKAEAEAQECERKWMEWLEKKKRRSRSLSRPSHPSPSE